MKFLTLTGAVFVAVTLAGCQTPSNTFQQQADAVPQHPAIKIFEDICLNSYPTNESALKSAAARHGIKNFETKHGKGMFGPYQYQSGTNSDQSMFVTYWPGKMGCLVKVRANTPESDKLIYHVQLGNAVKKKFPYVSPMQKRMTTVENGKVIEFMYFHKDGFDFFTLG
ncbi:hypothetical protein D8666_11690 [Ochrobactrum soli]|uniref:hypothetical protein n=1 Tax=Ochrobactrum soli TaxID=2448455 RepID=UPI000EF1A331|nr:hypothetical protein [[Ochrobactrum] soli]RLL73897.1 hypothetical protein D8666_11690 [[Ochrobactrum] soli]